MITILLTMFMLVVFFALIRFVIYVIQDKLEKNVPPPVTEEEKKAVEIKYEAVRRKILYISIAALVIGGIIGNYGIENENGFFLFSGVIVGLCGCVGVIGRTMIAPKTDPII